MQAWPYNILVPHIFIMISMLMAPDPEVYIEMRRPVGVREMSGSFIWSDSVHLLPLRVFSRSDRQDGGTKP